MNDKPTIIEALRADLRHQRLPFSERVLSGADDACWPWLGTVDPDGYGYTTFEGKQRRAHRVALARAKGLSMAAIEGLVVLHLCDNPPCCNPAHLLLGTQAENVADCHAKGRARGVFRPQERCKRGHDLTPENTYVHAATGKRRCAPCHCERQRVYEARKRAAQ